MRPTGYHGKAGGGGPGIPRHAWKSNVRRLRGARVGTGHAEDGRFDVVGNSAGQGNPDARLSLGGFRNTGDGVPEDPVEAYAWFGLAAAQGFGEAHVAVESLAGLMADREIEEARKLSREHRNAFVPGRDAR